MHELLNVLYVMTQGAVLHLDNDTVRVEVSRKAGPFRADVVMTARERPFVRIEEIPQATDKQRTLRAAWLAGRP